MQPYPLLSFDDLERVIKHMDEAAGDGFVVYNVEPDRVPPSIMARILNVEPATIHRWRAAGGVPYYSADLAAKTLGLHPLEIWPNFYNLEEPCLA